MYLALGIVFLIVALGIIGFVAFTMVRAYREERVILSKKNLVYLAPSFALVYALYLTASFYSGENVGFFYCVALVADTLDLFVFKAKVELILPIASSYPIFYADFALAVFVCAATAILSACSFFRRWIRNFLSVKRLLRRGCDVVIGDSPDAMKYLRHNPDSLLWGTEIGRERYAELLKEGVAVLRAPFTAKAMASRLKKRTYHIVVFRDGAFSNTRSIGIFKELRQCAGKQVYMHLEANQEETKVMKEKFISQADTRDSAYISCFNKYELVARKFVTDYPVTKFIPTDFYNDNFTLKSDKNVNVVFVGFGRMNYQLFRMFAMQFQFAEQVDGKLRSKPVQYYIFDNDKARLHNEFFSRVLYEVDAVYADCDFPKPEPICEIHKRKLDINSEKAKQKFRELVTENSFTYFVVSLDNDLEDASYARTVDRLFARDGKKNYRIFVRAKNNNNETLNRDDDSILYFGDERKIYTHDCVVNDDLTSLAKQIHLLYNKVKDEPQWLKEVRAQASDRQYETLHKYMKDDRVRQYIEQQWGKLPMIEQSSNLYHALNLSFKLRLLGFDMVKKSSPDDDGVPEADFRKRYVNPARDKNYTDYSDFFGLYSANVLAFMEHSRWNALYIFYDYVQMKKADIKKSVTTENGTVVLSHKDTARKQHACITTYYGLDELIRYEYSVCFPDAPAPTNTDKELCKFGKIYAYDYMDLDKLYAELHSLGYKLVDTRSA